MAYYEKVLIWDFKFSISFWVGFRPMLDNNIAFSLWGTFKATYNLPAVTNLQYI